MGAFSTLGETHGRGSPADGGASNRYPSGYPRPIWAEPNRLKTAQDLAPYRIISAVLEKGFVRAHRVPIISAAARNNVPAIYWASEFARNSGLLSYGFDLVDTWRRAASYVDRILRGAKPGDLPVQFPTRFETVVNLKTAKALGLTVPQSILLRADEIIE